MAQLHPAWRIALSLGSVTLFACQSASPTDVVHRTGPENAAAVDASAPDFLEVRFVEASGPPRQDPSSTRPSAPSAKPAEVESTPEDPDSADARLTEAQRELEREQARRLEFERENGTLQARVRDLEARVISLSLERARLEQELLQLRIDALRTELGRLESGATADSDR